ncbi:MAG: hypothetical protein NTY03_08300 [Candidatus Bathyarchaeota archaeon]|nr:hypothetical protein [Candidatus Bathyarchaeota archaeon]
MHPLLTPTSSRPKRIRNGKHQTLETLINEEAQLFTKYLIGEAKGWVPRVLGR